VSLETGRKDFNRRLSGQLIALESAIEHEVEALEDGACLLTLAGAA
jgi:hypothetical protein